MLFVLEMGTSDHLKKRFASFRNSFFAFPVHVKIIGFLSVTVWTKQL